MIINFIKIIKIAKISQIKWECVHFLPECSLNFSISFSLCLAVKNFLNLLLIFKLINSFNLVLLEHLSSSTLIGSCHRVSFIYRLVVMSFESHLLCDPNTLTESYISLDNLQWDNHCSQSLLTNSNETWKHRLRDK